MVSSLWNQCAYDVESLNVLRSSLARNINLANHLYYHVNDILPTFCIEHFDMNFKDLSVVSGGILEYY